MYVDVCRCVWMGVWMGVDVCVDVCVDECGCMRGCVWMGVWMGVDVCVCGPFSKKAWAPAALPRLHA